MKLVKHLAIFIKTCNFAAVFVAIRVQSYAHFAEYARKRQVKIIMNI